MIQKRATGAFVLAGGKSSRMGRAKGLLPIGGEPLAVRLAGLLEFTGEAPTIIGPTGPFAGLGFAVVEDEQAELGPLGGICTALHVSKHEWNLIVGCDLPFLTREWLEFLVARAMDSSADVVIPVNERGYEPLCAVYRKRAYGVIAAALNRGVRKITDALAELTMAPIARAEWKAFDPHGRLFKNINTPADYEQAQAEAETP
jgi:molybdenum cofactor guanylyltransferase